MQRASKLVGRVTRVFLVDDHDMVRTGIKQYLELHPDLRVVGEAGTAAAAVARITADPPDVVLMDVNLPDGDGIEVCRAVRGVRPGVRCLMLTSYADDDALLRAVLAGASGYVLKQIRGGDLVSCIRRVAAGEALLDDRAAQRIRERAARGSEDPRVAKLTLQERRILEHLAEGLTNRQIGERMHLAEKTVKNYVSNLLMKMGMERRTEAAAYAARMAERRQPATERPDAHLDPIRY